jgi:hypothetical protein
MMKKYLMMGIAALALASCSKDDITYINPDEAKYEMVFVNRFGTPNPNHTWGFGPETRALTRGVFANGNEWAANDRDDCKYRVPPALKPEQIAVVKKYFQTVKNPEYQDPHWTNYFIQQVYKGGSAALTGTNPAYNEPYSPETYTAADGSTQIVGSDHMDHLAAIDKTRTPEFVDHNENFNHGDCGDGYPNVLDFKGTLTTVEETYPVNSGNEHRHKDKINLMTNSTTKSFGYYNSTGSVRHTEYTGLVSFQTIINKLGAEANCLNDGWNRSFMGFDFEMMIGDGLYQTDNSSADGKRYVKISDIPGNAPQYIWDGERVIKWYEKVEYDANWKPIYTFAEGYDEYIRINGEKIPYLSTNTSMYAGLRLDAQTVLTNITQSNQKIYKDYSEDVKNVECLNLPLFKAAFEAGYYPTKDSNTDWVKVGGTADGYYSDWIVTLTEAKKYTTTIPDDDPYDYRVMAEDLSTNENSDFDFNDVVFDVKYVNSTTAKVKVRAAGGIYPIRIAGNDSYEIHALLGGSMTMLNTFKGHHYDLKAKEIEVSGSFGSSAGSDEFKAGVRNIKIEVSKDGSNTWVELTAPTGKAASKIGVPVNVDWCDEYQDIDERWGTGAFAAWVANEQAPFWKGI